jgi:hypothetical protein
MSDFLGFVLLLMQETDDISQNIASEYRYLPGQAINCQSRLSAAESVPHQSEKKTEGVCRK